MVASRQLMISIALGVVVLGAVILFAAVVIPGETFWLEASKVAMSALVAAFLSLVVGELVRARDERRDDERDLREYRRRFLLDAVEAYGRVKTARRTLRAKGLAPGGPELLSTAHLEALHTEITRLSDAQLTFMRQWREVSAKGGFSQHTELEVPLRKAKEYLSQIISEWEKGTPRLRDGVSADELHAWPRLRAFLLKRSDPESDFEVVSDALDDIEEAIWADVLPRSAKERAAGQPTTRAPRSIQTEEGAA